MRIHSEVIGAIAVFQKRSYLELYVQKEEEDNDYNFRDSVGTKKLKN